MQRGGLADFSVDQLLSLGASYPPATIGEHRWETLVTASFLHSGIPHVTFSILALWLTGPVVERVLGPARMAPVYLISGIAGHLTSVGQALVMRTAGIGFGASGAISGVVAAALVLALRVHGREAPLVHRLARWLGLVVAVGLLMSLGAGRDDEPAQLAGVITGAIAGWLANTDRVHTPRANASILAGCAGVLVASVGALGWRDRTDRFAPMDLEERSDFTMDAIAEGRCRDAKDGLAAVDRLRAWAAPVTSLRTHVDAVCGR
jgi:membrane associated rhomboid family serine protease